MPTITPFLWFDRQAEEAMNFYASIFERSKVISVNRAQGKVMSVQFELEGQRFIALNAGPNTSSAKPSRFSWAAKPRRRSTTLGEARRRWRLAQPVRLAEGQVRTVVADSAEFAGPDAGRARIGQVTASDAGDASDEEARPAAGAACLRRRLTAAAGRRGGHGRFGSAMRGSSILSERQNRALRGPAGPARSCSDQKPAESSAGAIRHDPRHAGKSLQLTDSHPDTTNAVSGRLLSDHHADTEPSALRAPRAARHAPRRQGRDL